MFDDAGMCYWLLWVLNCKTFWLFFLLGCGTMALWPVIIDKVEVKADRIRRNQKHYDFVKLGNMLQKAYNEEGDK